MANQTQILENRLNIKQSIAPRGPGDAFDLYNGVDMGSLNLKCVICTKNQAGIINLIMQNKANFTYSQGGKNGSPMSDFRGLATPDDSSFVLSVPWHPPSGRRASRKNRSKYIPMTGWAIFILVLTNTIVFMARFLLT